MDAARLHEAIKFEDDWTLAEVGDFPNHSLYLETIFAQANGYLGMRGSFEEGPPTGADSEPYFVCQGVFDQQPGRYETDSLVNLPDWLPIQLTLDGTSLGSEEVEILDRERRLSLRDSTLTREFLIRLPDGDVRVTLRRFLSQANRHLAAWKMTLSAEDAEVEVSLRWGITADRTNRGTVHFSETDREIHSDLALHEICTLESGIIVAQAQAARLRIDGEHATPQAAGEVNDEDFAGVRWEFELQPSEEITVERFNAVCTSRDREDRPALDRARAHAFSAAEDGYAVAALQNAAAWSRKWIRSDVQIDGDEVADRALRYCSFQLMQANLDDDERTAIGAKALSGPGYRGHFFWDTEMFMEPFFAHTHPPAARNLVAFRHMILPGAKRLAREMGCEGARWPWEATRDGREQCPRWLPENGGEVRIVTGEQEDHISSAVAWGAWYYYQVTGDEDFWYRRGVELLVEAARFWKSRVEWNAERESYEIRRVMGPDENHEMVDNNAYTNYMAAWTLEAAARAVAELHTLESGRERIESLKLQDAEVESWLEVAESIYLPLHPETCIIPQHDGFIEQMRSENGVDALKQADVLMLLRIFPDLFPPDVQRRNWETYEPITEHGSSLSPSVHAIVAARLGMHDEAEDYLRRSLLIDLADTQGNTDEGLHAAALGGAWMAVVHGIGGLHVDIGGRLHLDPRLPPGWERLSFSARLRGGVLRCEIDRERMSLMFRHPRSERLEITVAGEPIRVHPGQRLDLPG